MKCFWVVAIIFSAVICGCSGDSDKQEIENVISKFGDAMLEKDLEKLITTIEDGSELKDQMNGEHFFTGVNFFTFKLIDLDIRKNVATAELEAELEELVHRSSEYITLKFMMTLQLKNTKDGWIIYDLSSELAPGYKRPERP